MSVLYRKINQQQQICRKFKKIFLSLSKSSYQPPLQKALSCESTFIREHINRLKMIKSLLVSFNKNIGKPLKLKRIKLKQFSTKNKANQQDKLIVKFALKLFEIMNENLIAIQKLSASIAQAFIDTLIEKSIQENADSIQWLTNINHNILATDRSSE